MKRNCYGKRIYIENEIEDESFLRENGEIAWGDSNPYATEGGFDSRFEIIDNYELKRGERIVRYGPLKGHNSSVLGTPYDELSLPYVVNSVQYHELLVRKDMKVRVVVKKGVVAADFNRKGLGVQYTHYCSIQDDIDAGNIKEVKSWVLPTWIKNFF